MKKIILGFMFGMMLVPVMSYAGTPAIDIVNPNPGIDKNDQQTVVDQSLPSLPNPLGDKIGTIPDLIYLLINVVVSVSYVIIAFFLILSGFKFVTAQGSEDKLTDAKNTFKNTIIGAILVIGAQVIVDVVRNIITQLK